MPQNSGKGGRVSRIGSWREIQYVEHGVEEETFFIPPEPNVISGEEMTNIYDFDVLDKPFLKPEGTENLVIDDKYHTGCYLTSNLYCEQFLRNMKNKKYKIEFYDSPYHEFHVQSLFMKNVEAIEITDVDLNLDFMFHMVENRGSLRFLTRISLCRCKVNSDMLAIICPEIEHAFNLVEIDLSENPLGDLGFQHILIYLYDWTNLKNLILVNTGLSHKSFEMLGALYASRKLFISKLNLSRNICNKIRSLKRLLLGMRKQSAPLEELILTHCGFEGNEVASSFESSLKPLKRLKLLDLSFNLFREEEDVIPLADLLMASRLKTLDLSFNLVKETSALALLNQVYSYPPTELQKSLVISNYSIPQRYPVQNPDFLERTDIVVHHAGIRELKLPRVDNAKQILIRRLNFLYQKGKPKKDQVVESIKESLPRKFKTVKVDDFKDALLGIPSKKIDVLLVQEIVEEFSGGGPKANAREFINIYDELFPRKSRASSTMGSVVSSGSARPSAKVNRNGVPRRDTREAKGRAEVANQEQPTTAIAT